MIETDVAVPSKKFPGKCDVSGAAKEGNFVSGARFKPSFLPGDM